MPPGRFGERDICNIALIKVVISARFQGEKMKTNSVNLKVRGQVGAKCIENYHVQRPSHFSPSVSIIIT